MKTRILALIGAVVVVWVALSAAFGPDRPSTGPSAPAPTSGETRDSSWTLKTAALGCLHRETHDRLTRYAVARDKEAHDRYARAKLADGECRAIEAGKRVFIEESAIWSAGLVKVRGKGELDAYWIHAEALANR